MVNSCPNRFDKDKIVKKDRWWVFTAGPIQGAPDWQHSLPHNDKIIWQSPRRESYDNFDYDVQFQWEHDMMVASDIIMFWIPKEIEHIEGRQYAQTTRTEFGEYLAMGKKIFIGIEEADFPGRRYFESKAAQYGIEVRSTLKEVLKDIAAYISKCEHDFKECYTSDTHFTQQRALELSRRPFRDLFEMDWTLIKNWNNVVHPNDRVYHLGDFGDLWPLNYLNGEIILIAGNYEDKDFKEHPELKESYDKLFEEILDSSEFGCLDDEDEPVIKLAHEPIKAKKLLDEVDAKKKFALFGHIHGRQKIKEFGIDVGVDANNYRPMTTEDVEFYLNAIDKGYYDEEVFV